MFILYEDMVSVDEEMVSGYVDVVSVSEDSYCFFVAAKRFGAGCQVPGVILVVSRLADRRYRLMRTEALALSSAVRGPGVAGTDCDPLISNTLSSEPPSISDDRS